MRLAVMIIGLCLAILIGLQSCTMTIGSSLLQDEATAGAGAVGMLLAFLFILGAALVWNFPRVSGALFLLGGILAVGASVSSKFKDLSVWGCVSLTLSVMAFIGARELAKGNVRTVYVPVPDQPNMFGVQQVPVERRSVILPAIGMALIGIAVVIGLFASGMLRLGPNTAGPVESSNVTEPASAPVNNEADDYESVEGSGEVDVEPNDAPQNSTAFVDSTGNADDARADVTETIAPGNDDAGPTL